MLGGADRPEPSRTLPWSLTPFIAGLQIVVILQALCERRDQFAFAGEIRRSFELLLDAVCQVTSLA